ncbi:MAG TPA: hypothetical protein VIG72_05175 [Pontibacter sp.]
MDNKNTTKEQTNEDEKNWLEWLVFCISLLLVSGIFAYLVYQVIGYTSEEPDVFAEAHAAPSRLSPNRYRVTVYNKGGATAEEVIVDFTLFKAGEELERSEMQIPFSPVDSKREGWVIFSNNPAQADSLVARVVSYKKP